MSLSRRQFLHSAFIAGAGLVLTSTTHAQSTRLYCPILMYHYIAEAPPDADRTLRDLCVTPTRFAEHLDRLSAEGFTSITLERLLRGLIDGEALPPKPVVLSFDDGHDNAYGAAFPALAARGMVGSFYIITQAMDTPRYLTWGQAGDMWNAGMEIGNHSATHASLRGLSASALSAETQGSADTIQSILGKRPLTYCYPFGHFDRPARIAVRDSGHLGAITTQDGTLHSPEERYILRRVRVRYSTSAEQLSALVNRQV